MYKTRLYLAVLITIGAGALFAFTALFTAAAQTNDGSTASPAPTPPVIATPPPLIVESDGEIVIDTELVNLNVRVVDRNNKSIANLLQSDFEVYEDRVLQPIGFFSTSEVPTNYTLVIDNSGSLREQLEDVIDAGKTIIQTNRPNDETSIIRFVSSDKIMLEQDFTSEKEDLMDALDNLYIEGGQTAIIDAVYLAADRVNEYEKVRNDAKRRALILVTDGEDRDSVYTEKQLYELLRETNVQIYVIGFVKGLDSKGGLISKSPQKKAKAFLTTLAEDTGGKVYFPNALSELESIAIDIAKELRTQYSIGYIPTNDRLDGSFRNIKVVVKDGPSKEKRIALTRTGRVAVQEPSLKPAIKKSNQ
ncbi:MAG: VWA domain-containing protein [Acidobacteriota bacterium]|nr:VWA domain-containing protein [Acidobacteriota bacterium]MDH3528424.1 VWA domain-containing protein [Acidobacteriota bacterium]